MKKHMRIGEIAKKVLASTNTLRFYDKEGLLSPSAVSESGYRLYTEGDLVKLMQIQLMKELGFSLAEIKARMKTISTTADIVGLLAEQAAVVREKIGRLTDTLADMETLAEEISRVESVDYLKFLGILMNLKMKNEQYWLIKHMDGEILETVSENMTHEKAAAFVEEINRIYGAAAELSEKGESPSDENAQKLADEFWEMQMKMVGGDIELWQKMSKSAENFPEGESTEAQNFIGLALDLYLKEKGINT